MLIITDSVDNEPTVVTTDQVLRNIVSNNWLTRKQMNRTNLIDGFKIILIQLLKNAYWFPLVLH